MSYRDTLSTLVSIADSVASGTFGEPTDDITSLVYYDGIRARVLGTTQGSGGASMFLQLTDTPGTYGSAGQILHIFDNAGSLRLDWRNAPREVPDPTAVPNGRVLTASGGAYSFAALPPTVSAALSRGSLYVGNISNTAAPLSPGPSNTVLSSNGQDLSWVNRFLSFTQLTDTPGLLGTPLQNLRVNSAGTALEFYTPIVGAPTLPENNIFLGNDQGQAAPLAPGNEGAFFTMQNGAPTWSVLDGIFKARGSWDASTGNAPTETPVAGDYYTVGVAGNFQAIFYGTDDAIYYADGAWHKVEGGQGLTANNTLRGADDTVVTLPTAGQGYVWDPNGNPQIGAAGSGAFVLRKFINAAELDVNDYAVGRVLEADGDKFVSVDKLAMPKLPVLGSLWAADPNNGPQAIPPATSTAVLTGNSITGRPAYVEFQTLLNAASVPNTSLAVQNQVLTSNRTVSVGSRILTMATSANAAALSLDGVTRRVILAALSVGGILSRIELRGDSIDLDLRDGAKLRLNAPGAGLTAGVDGQAIVAPNILGSPHWGYPDCVLTAPDGRFWKLYVDNNGILSTVEVAGANFAPVHPEEVPV